MVHYSYSYSFAFQCYDCCCEHQYDDDGDDYDDDNYDDCTYDCSDDY